LRDPRKGCVSPRFTHPSTDIDESPVKHRFDGSTLRQNIGAIFVIRAATIACERVAAPLALTVESQEH
jgi:hypothetical protein